MTRLPDPPALVDPTFCANNDTDASGDRSQDQRTSEVITRTSRILGQGSTRSPTSSEHCDTAIVAHKQRQMEQLEFSVGEPTRVLEWMAHLAGAGQGWINLVPKLAGEDDKPTSLRFFTLLSGGGNSATMITWIPGRHDHAGHDRVSLGITHSSGQRAAGELRSLAVAIPETWLVEQDHPRRGLVLRVPSEAANEQVLSWAMRALGALLPPRPITGWRADIYLPITQ